MAEIVRQAPWDVRQRLAALCGLEVEVLQTAVQTGHVAFLSCTDNDPPFIPGTYAWSRTLRALREGLIGSGWRKDDSGNYSLTVSDRHRINIVVASGDDLTGLVHSGDPRTKSPKGPRTENVVEANAQGDLFPHTLPRRSSSADGRPYDTWVLLMRVKAEELRAELSRPTAMEDGHISGWSERIILPLGKVDPTAIDIAPDDFGPDFDLDLRRIA